jgi:hypothetical protein
MWLLQKRIGMAREHDLFGGVVPFPFLATRNITHDLPLGNAYAPHGWSQDFARCVQQEVLPRFSACTISDARSGVTRFFQSGKVRAKKASDVGGHSQSVIADADELEAFLKLLEIKNCDAKAWCWKRI